MIIVISQKIEYLSKYDQKLNVCRKSNVCRNITQIECFLKIQSQSNAFRNITQIECLSKYHSESNICRDSTHKRLFMEISLKFEYLSKNHSN